jgi:hypothetical protein
MPSRALHGAALAFFVLPFLALETPQGAAAQETAQAASSVAGQAIAVSRGGQRWGVGHAVGAERWGTLLRAAQQAMQQCGRYDCRVQFQSVNPNDRCATFARGTSSYGLGVGPTAEAARSLALESCTMTTSNCHVVDERCP